MEPLGRSSTSEPDAICTYWTRDVFDVLLTGELQRMSQLPVQVVIGGAGDENPAWITELLQARGDVDAVAEEIVAFNDNVTKIDPDAEQDAPLPFDIPLMGGNLGLDRHCKMSGVYD